MTGSIKTNVTMTNSGQLRLEIDKNRLDEEWENQPVMYFQQGQKTAAAQLEVDKARAALSLKEAKLDSDIRKNPEDYIVGYVEGQKVTEVMVKNAILAQPDYLALEAKVNDRKYDLNIANAAIVALEHRKRALTLITELFFKEYFDRRASRKQDGSTTDAEKAEIRRRGQRSQEDKLEDAESEGS